MKEKLTQKARFACPVDHVVLKVRSLPASTAYYQALLPLVGFKPTSETRWHNPDGFMIDLQQAEPGTADYDRFAPGLNHLGFRATFPEILEEVRTAMRTAGFFSPEVQEFPGALALFMEDPDGIRFEIGFELELL